MTHPRNKVRIPKYRRQKSTPHDRAFVEIRGRRIYLGEYGSEASKTAYHRSLAEYSSSNGHMPVGPDGITVVELAARFWAHAELFYRKPDGTTTSTLHNYKAALRFARELYGTTRVEDFGPRCLKVCRDRMIAEGWCRRTCNQVVNLLRGVFRWGVSEELVSPQTHAALVSVAPLRAGRSKAKDHPPVGPVEEEHVAAVRTHVSRQVWALIRLQLLTAARAGELVGLRSIDIDTSGRVWTARLADHKKAYAGKRRVVYFGPQAQEVLREFMADRPVDAFLFSPREAEEERGAQAKTHRRPGQKPNPRKTSRVLGNRYDTPAVRLAITRACEKAGVPPWTPHRLRHTAATAVRKEFGIEASSLLLGHANLETSEIYAEADTGKAIAIALKIG